jgi:transketolase
VINIGICEQATIGICAGMAKEGLHPIFYTIAPFAVERCFEQIKIDIGYQNLPISIVSVGGSYDYSALGCTHHCPADVALMKTIPGMNVFTPAYRVTVDTILNLCHGNEALYMRLPDEECREVGTGYVTYGNNLVLAFGDTIDNVAVACKGLGVDVFQCGYVNVHVSIVVRKKVVIVEPWYRGTMQYDVQLMHPDAKILSIGVPRKFITSYGSKEDHDKECGLDVDGLRETITSFLNG